VLGFTDVFITGGEPFILDEIYDIVAYTSARVNTTVLTNATLLRGKRLERLQAIANDNLSIQVSLDGGRPEHHDAYRGEGTWAKTVEGIKQLQAGGIHVCISTTETPANSAHLDELHAFRRCLSIADEDHFVRPVAKRGFSQEGLEVGPHNLVPEVTVAIEGVYWHPLISPSATDMRVSEQIFPLVKGVECIQRQLDMQGDGSEKERTKFT
jgi:sulfatase maturation enzyme AslB (radical SAM superfamily)